MDFDPSAFLSMDMTEDQNAVYTAPDVPQGFSPIKIPEGNIVVEGGLQMEQEMQIPVPVFGLLQQEDEPMVEAVEENVNDAVLPEDPIHIDISEQGTSTPQPSPGEKTISPCNKKVILTSYEETRFRRELFSGHFERVKIFRLHCSICAKHLGCAPWFTERQMRMHKLLSVIVCRKCFEFYGDINFPVEDGSELFCCWCGEGGECFCCSTCPKIVCKKCISRNFGPEKIKEIDKNDDWSCFVCKPEDIWPHRALMWGLQRWSKGMRQLVAMLSKEEKQAKLSFDTSQCCLKPNNGFAPVGLPTKAVLSKVPLSLIASPYRTVVKEVLARQDTYINQTNGLYPLQNNTIRRDLPMNNASQRNLPMNNISRGDLPNNILPPNMQKTLTQVPGTLTQLPRAISDYHVRQQVQQVIQRSTLAMTRPAPYPMNRNMTPTLRPPQPPQYTQRIVNYTDTSRYRSLPQHQSSMNVSHPSNVVDLEGGAIVHQNVQTQLMDISSLENGVRDVKDLLRPTLLMLDQFDLIKNDLANDISKLTSFSERLSYNIKIAICNLAKANTDLIESQKKIIDSRVSNVVNSIQFTVDTKFQSENRSNSRNPVLNGTLSAANQGGNRSSTKVSNTHTVIDSSPEIIEGNNSPKTAKLKKSYSDNAELTTPSSSTAEEVEDVAIAMLCETVLEVEENKENKDGANKDQTTPVKVSQQAVNKAVKGKRKSRTISRKKLIDQSVSSEIPVICLSDEEEETKGTFDESFWCKKFKIVPCKVILENIKIVKVDVE